MEIMNIFDFTQDELEQNREGFLSHRQRQFITTSKPNWQARLVAPGVSSVTTIIVPTFLLFNIYGAYQQANDALWLLLSAITAIFLIVGISVTATLALFAWRGVKKDSLAFHEDLDANEVRYVHAITVEDVEADMVYAVDVNSEFVMHDAGIDQLPPNEEFILYCTPASHRILSVEPFNSNDKRQKPRCLPLRPEGVTPRHNTFDEAYVPTMSRKAAV